MALKPKSSSDINASAFPQPDIIPRTGSDGLLNPAFVVQIVDALPDEVAPAGRFVLTPEGLFVSDGSNWLKIRAYKKVEPFAFFPLKTDFTDLQGNVEASGEGDYSFTGEALNLTGSGAMKLNDVDVLTIYVEFKWDGSGGWSTLISSKPINQTGNNIKLAVVDGQLATWHNGRKQVVVSGIEAGRWYKVVVRQGTSSDTYDYFLNGSLVASDLPDNNANLTIRRIGADSEPLNEAFNGQVRNVKFYNKRLDNEEISEL